MSKSKLKLNLTLALCAAANLLLNAPQVQFLTLGGNDACDPISVTEATLDEMLTHAEAHANEPVEPAQMEQWFGPLREDLRSEHKFMIKQDGPENVFISVTKLLPFYDRKFTDVVCSEDEILRHGTSRATVQLGSLSERKTMAALVQENPDIVLRCVVPGYPSLIFCHGPLRILLNGFIDQALLEKTSLREVLESLSATNEELLSLSLEVLSLSEEVRRVFIGRSDITFITSNNLRKMSIDDQLALLKRAHETATEVIREIAQAEAIDATGQIDA